MKLTSEHILVGIGLFLAGLLVGMVAMIFTQATPVLSETATDVEVKGRVDLDDYTHPQANPSQRKLQPTSNPQIVPHEI